MWKLAMALTCNGMILVSSFARSADMIDARDNDFLNPDQPLNFVKWQVDIRSPSNQNIR